MKKIIYCFFIGIFLFFSGCNLIGGEEKENSWPQEKTLSIQIEGMEEEIDVKLFWDEDLGIKTYYPAHMKAISGEKEVWFYFLWNGEINEQAYVKFCWISPEKGLNPVELVSRPEVVFPEEGWELSEKNEGTEKWIEKEFYFLNLKLDRGAVVELGKQGDRFFIIVTQFQHEYGDGIFPRAKLIKENLFFWDRGEYLLEKSFNDQG